MQRSEAINQEKNRAQKAAQYAELRCASLVTTFAHFTL